MLNQSNPTDDDGSFSYLMNTSISPLKDKSQEPIERGSQQKTGKRISLRNNQGGINPQLDSKINQQNKNKRISLKYQRGQVNDKLTIELDPVKKQQAINKRISLMYAKGIPQTNQTYEMEPTLRRESLLQGMVSLNRRLAAAIPVSPKGYQEAQDYQSMDSALQNSRDSLIRSEVIDVNDMTLNNPDTSQYTNNEQFEDIRQIDFQPMQPLNRKSTILHQFQRIQIEQISEEDIRDDESEKSAQQRASILFSYQITNDKSFLISLAKSSRLNLNATRMIWKRVTKTLSQPINNKNQNPSQVTFMDLLTFILFIIATIVFLGISAVYFVIRQQDCIEITKPYAYNEAKRLTSQLLAGLTVAQLTYGIILMIFGSFWVFLVLFFVQTFPFLFFFLNTIYKGYFYDIHFVTDQEYIISIYLVGTYIFWLFLVMIHRDLRRFANVIYANIAVLTYYIIFGLSMIGLTIYKGITTMVITWQWLYEVTSYILPCYFILLTLLACYIYFRFYHLLFVRLNEDSRKKSQLRHQRYVGITSGFAFCLIVITLTGLNIALFHKQVIEARNLYYYTYFNHQVEKQTIPTQYHEMGINVPFPQWSFYMLLFMLAFIPCFVISTSIVLMNGVSYTLKLATLPIMVTVIPSFFFIPLSLLFNQDDMENRFAYYKYFFVFGPSCIALYWVTLLLIKQKNTSLAASVNAWCMLFLFVPFLYIQPLTQANVFEDEVYFKYATGFYWGLILTGFIILLILLLAKAYRLMKDNPQQYYQSNDTSAIQNIITVTRKTRSQLVDTTQQNQIVITPFEEQKVIDTRTVTLQRKTLDQVNNSFEFLHILRLNLINEGLWINSCGFIIAFSILALIYYYRPYWVNNMQSGTILGLMAVIIHLFCLCIIILELPVVGDLYTQQHWDREFQLSYILSVLMQRDLLKNKQVSQERIRRSVMHFGYLELPLICLILFLIFYYVDHQPTVFMFNLTLLVGSYVVTTIFYAQIRVKTSMTRYQYALIPLLVGFTWVFIYIPFLSILPSAYVYLSIDREDLVFWERLTYSSTAILLTLAITLIMFIAFLYFKRYDAERRQKFIANKLIKKLAKEHIKADYFIVDEIYQLYLMDGIKEAKKKLKSHKPVDWIDYSQTLKNVDWEIELEINEQLFLKNNNNDEYNSFQDDQKTNFNSRNNQIHPDSDSYSPDDKMQSSIPKQNITQHRRQSQLPMVNQQPRRSILALGPRQSINPLIEQLQPKEGDVVFKKLLVDANGLERWKKQKVMQNDVTQTCCEKFNSFFKKLFYYCCCYNEDQQLNSGQQNNNLEGGQSQQNQIQQKDQGNPFQNNSQNTSNFDQNNIKSLLGVASTQHRRISLFPMRNNKINPQEEGLFLPANDTSFYYNYISNLKRRPMPLFVYDALKWYETPVHLNPNSEEQKELIAQLFSIFSTRVVRSTNQRSMDYIAFKNLCVCAGFEDNRLFFDHMIDTSYAALTEVDKKPCMKAMNPEDLQIFLKDLSQEFWPFDEEEIAYGHILQFYVFPHLLWNIVPLRPHYMHDWEYVLFLLRQQGYNDLADELLAEENEFHKKLQQSLGIEEEEDLNNKNSSNNPDLNMQYQDIYPDSWAKKLLNYLTNIGKNLAYYCKSCCQLDRKHHDQQFKQDMNYDTWNDIEYIDGSKPKLGKLSNQSTNQASKSILSTNQDEEDEDEVEKEYRWVNINLLSDINEKELQPQQKRFATLYEEDEDDYSDDDSDSQSFESVHSQQANSKRPDSMMELSIRSNERVHQNKSQKETAIKDEVNRPTPIVQENQQKNQARNQSQKSNLLDNQGKNDSFDPTLNKGWEDLVDQMLNEIQKQDQIYSKMERRPIYVMRINGTNTVFAISKILEYVILASWAFRSQVDWGLDEQAIKVLNTLNTEADYANQYRVLMWMTLIITALFIVMTYNGIVGSKTFHHGYSEGGLRRRRCSLDFIQIMLMQLIYYPCSLLMLKTLFDSNSCDYLIFHKRLYRDSSIVCLSDEHSYLMVFAGFVTIVLLPVAAFVYPHLQQQNR